MQEQHDSTPVDADEGVTRRTALIRLISATLISTAVGGVSAPVGAQQAASRTLPPTLSPVTVLSVNPLPRALHTATCLADGSVLVVGGLSANNRALESAQIYDPVRDLWREAAPLATARFQHAAAALPNGMVLITGGLHRSDKPLAGGEVYNPSANTWSPAPAMLVERYGHTLTILTDGRVMVMGGIHRKPLSSAEVYDPFAV